jgi:acetolactate synthase-1/2/3 large subunit
LSRLTGGQTLVRTLKAAGIDTIFGIPALHNLDIYDALFDEPSLRHITPRHEQGAGFMADGYARAKGDVGVILSSSGPGGAFAAVPLAEATTDGSPVLHITCAVPRSLQGRRKGTLHEGVDHLGLMKSVSLRAERVADIRDIPHAVFRAISSLRAGPAGAISLELPFDVLAGEAEVKIPTYQEASVKLQPDDGQLAKAASLLSAARRPVIWAGGGVIAAGATEGLQQVAEILRCPVINSIMGQGAFPADHPQHLGNTAMEASVREMIAQSDVMLAVGTRLRELDTDGWRLPIPEALVQVDADSDQIGRNYPVKVAVHADARLALAELAARLRAAGGEAISGEWSLQEIAVIKQAAWEDARKRAPAEMAVLETLRSAIPEPALVYAGRTSVAYWATRFMPVYEPRTFFYGMGYGTVGFALPAAIGGKVAVPDRPVVVIVGDGGFMYTCNELATAAQFGIHIVVLLFNDNCYAAIKDNQRRRFGDRPMAVDLVNPDFVALARSFGLGARRVDDIDEVLPALEEVFSSTIEKTLVVELPFALRQP